MTWTEASGIPYSSAASLHVGWSLGKVELRPQQNLLLGPLVGVRFADLAPPGRDWEGFAGLRLSGRVFRSAIPVDVVWGVDASVGTERRVPLGVSIGAGLQQAWTFNVRFAYDVHHTEPLLEGVVTVPLLSLGGKRAAPCPSVDLGSPRSLAGRIRLQAATLSSRFLRPGDELPEALPNSVTDLDSFRAALQGRVAAEVLDRSHLERLIRTAGGDPADHDDRATALLILDGWRARITLMRCRQT